MIKRTLLFSNPCYLSTKHKQLVVNYPHDSMASRTVPIEDIGIIILEHQQITLTNGLISLLINNNTAIVTCNQQHLPIAYTMPLSGNSLQGQRFREQIGASQALKKNIWQQTIKSKILNQAILLEKRGINADNLRRWGEKVQSGDVTNQEARAAAYYWNVIFGKNNFIRNPEGEMPNALLNYGYAILRALCARSLVGSGLLPMLGVFHRNKYNAYPLADDIMEPYRPIIDALVCDIITEYQEIEELSLEIKQKILSMVNMDVVIDGKMSPLMVAMSRTTSSLYHCFSGESRKVLYPLLVK